MFGIRQMMTGRCGYCGTWNPWGYEECHGCHARLHPWRLPLAVMIATVFLIVCLSIA